VQQLYDDAKSTCRRCRDLRDARGHVRYSVPATERIPPADGGVIVPRLTRIALGRESAVRGPRPGRDPSPAVAQPPTGRWRRSSGVRISRRPTSGAGRHAYVFAVLQRRGGLAALLNLHREHNRHTYLVSRSTVITEAVTLGRDRSIAHRDG